MTDTPETVNCPPNDRIAFDRTAPFRAALDLGQAPPYTLDAVHAAAVALGIARRLQPYRDAMRTLPGFDVAHLDHLEDYANGLLFAQWTLVARAERVRQLPALAEEGYQIRALLLAYADVLVLKGQVAPDVVQRLREGSGYRDLVEDLGVLVTVLRERVHAKAHGMPVSAEELDHALDVAAALTNALGAVADPDLGHDTLMVERRKLGVLLVRAQSQLRRAMAYLRFDEKDAEALVPTLYVPGRRHTAAEEPATEGAPTGAPAATVSAATALDGADSPFES